MSKAVRQVGYFCSLVPVEIMQAAGLQARRVTGQSEGSSGGDAYLYHNLCPYIKSVMSTALNGGLKELDGVVFARSCDGMRRLYDAWRTYVGGGFSYMLEVPLNTDEKAAGYFASQLRDFAVEAGNFSGKAVTDKSLKDAIAGMNRSRQQVRRLMSLREKPPLAVSGSTMFRLGQELLAGSPGAADSLQESYQKASSVAGKDRNGRLRVLISGNVMDRPDLFQMLEEAGADVPAADLCTDVRYFDREVDEKEADPYLALARAYLGKPHCAHTATPVERAKEIRDIVKRYGIDGVLLTSVKFCDLHLYDAPVILKSLAEAGVPVQFIENDYTFAGKSQMKVRVEAFVEVLDSRRS